MSAPRTRVIASQTITRPADTTAYADNDLVANDTTAGSVTPFLFSDVVRQVGYKNKITRAGIRLSGTAVTNGTFRLHLFKSAPTVGAGDNAAMAVATGNDNYIGYLEIILSMTGSGAGGVRGWSVNGANVLSFVSENSKNLWGLLQAKGAYTPISAETIQVLIEVE